MHSGEALISADNFRRLFDISNQQADFMAYMFYMTNAGNSAVSIKRYLATSKSKQSVEEFTSELQDLTTENIFHINEHDPDMVYPQRIWHYETQIAKKLVQLAGSKNKNPIKLCSNLPADSLSKLNDEQKKSLELVNHRKFHMINGPPGSGKSFLLAHLLVGLLETAKQNNYPKIIVASPTAKANIRLRKLFLDIAQQVAQTTAINDNDYQAISFETLHQLLHITPYSLRAPKNNQNKLVCDWLIIDEASMMSLEMLYSVLQSVTTDVQLVLSGDKEQLPAVQGGCNFGALLEAFSQHPSAAKNNLTQLTQIVRQKDENSQLARLLLSIKEDQPADVIKRLSEDVFVDEDEHTSLKKIVNVNFDKAKDMLNAGTHQEALDIASKSMLLTFNRYKINGCNQINQKILNRVNRELTPTNFEGGYHAMPFIVKQNNRLKDIYNGEMGLFFYTEQNGWEAQIPVQQEDTKKRNIYDIRFFQPAFAITVHESQGSEFEQVYVLLAEPGSSLNNKEVLYTAVSRAKSSVQIIGKKQALLECLENNLQSFNGLKAKITQQFQSYQ